ncbi:hypothetical protein SEA_BARSTEN_51 [Gordonia Phage Barsten]|uniref:Uncharacterized protein n=1 Tax=Gordonia Phage Barsten TaxID=2743907 RepID=A0A7G3VBZ6_9CAUD|nr:hypothetical protein KNV14_gp51 [Gordonia Phage Barsten]QKY78406.1 hypothetical protein SEA_BARSTEN_51 [Gordonia Phage Barsten]UQT02068.1 hypothetical protein SEA_CHADMASTERC_51 [Gordonia phage ChadMasterC]
MTGAEHYDQALRLLAAAGRWSDDADECRRRGTLAAVEVGDRRASREHDLEARESDRKARRCRDDALIHATLAQTAATALQTIATVNAGNDEPYDDHTIDAAGDWHLRVTIAGERGHTTNG